MEAPVLSCLIYVDSDFHPKPMKWHLPIKHYDRVVIRQLNLLNWNSDERQLDEGILLLHANMIENSVCLYHFYPFSSHYYIAYRIIENNRQIVEFKFEM